MIAAAAVDDDRTGIAVVGKLPEPAGVNRHRAAGGVHRAGACYREVPGIDGGGPGVSACGVDKRYAGHVHGNPAGSTDNATDLEYRAGSSGESERVRAQGDGRAQAQAIIGNGERLGGGQRDAGAAK